jgi:hypothetical protein
VLPTWAFKLMYDRWMTVGQDPHYSWGDTSLPYLNLKGEDAFENPTFFDKPGLHLAFGVSLTLLKIKLFLDLKSLQRCKVEYGDSLTTELLVHILGKVIQSDIIRDNRAICVADDHNETLTLLKEQLTKMYATVHKMNKFFWPLFWDMQYPSLPSIYMPMSKEEAHLAFIYTLQAFEDVPDSIGVIKSLKDEHSP